VWDVSTGTRVRTFRGHFRSVWGLGFGPDGEWLASGCEGGDVRLWTVGDRSVRPGGAGRRPRFGPAVAPADGSVIAFARDDVIDVRDVATGRRLRALRHTAPASALAVAPDGSWVAAAHTDRTIRVHDPRDGRPLHTFSHFAWDVPVLAAAPDGTWLLAVSAFTHPHSGAEAYDLATGTRRWQKWPSRQRLTLAAVGGTWCVVGDGGLGYVLDTATGRTLHTLDDDERYLSGLAVAPRGGWIVTASEDSVVRRWDAATGALLSRTTGDPGGIRAVAVSPDETLLALAGWDNELRVQEVDTARTVAVMRVDGGVLRSCCWLPDGGICVAAEAGVYVFGLGS
jgi:WD40 repeat protein